MILKQSQTCVAMVLFSKHLTPDEAFSDSDFVFGMILIQMLIFGSKRQSVLQRTCESTSELLLSNCSKRALRCDTGSKQLLHLYNLNRKFI